MLKGVRQRQGVVHTPRPQKEAKDPDAMDVDAVQLRQRGTVRCYRCNRDGHIARNCTVPPKRWLPRPKNTGQPQQQQRPRNSNGQWRGLQQGGQNTQVRAVETPATTKIEEVKEESVKSVDVNALKAMSIKDFDDLARQFYQGKQEEEKKDFPQ